MSFSIITHSIPWRQGLSPNLKLSVSTNVVDQQPVGIYLSLPLTPQCWSYRLTWVPQIWTQVLMLVYSAFLPTEPTSLLNFELLVLLPPSPKWWQTCTTMPSFMKHWELSPGLHEYWTSTLSAELHSPINECSKYIAVNSSQKGH